MNMCTHCGATVTVEQCPFCGSNDVVASTFTDQPTAVLPPGEAPQFQHPGMTAVPQPTQVISTIEPPGVAPAPRKGKVGIIVGGIAIVLAAALGIAYALGAFSPPAPAKTATPAPVAPHPSPTPSALPTTTPVPAYTTPPVTPAPYVPPPPPAFTPPPVVVTVPPPVAAPTYPTVRVPVGKECSRTGSGPFAASGTANSTTSCSFAKNVREAYVRDLNGADGSIRAFSPTTKQTYTLNCSGTQPVLCTGGRAGRVVIYGGQLRVG